MESSSDEEEEPPKKSVATSKQTPAKEKPAVELQLFQKPQHFLLNRRR